MLDLTSVGLDVSGGVVKRRAHLFRCSMSSFGGSWFFWASFELWKQPDQEPELLQLLIRLFPQREALSAR